MTPCSSRKWHLPITEGSILDSTIQPPAGKERYNTTVTPDSSINWLLFGLA